MCRTSQIRTCLIRNLSPWFHSCCSSAVGCSRASCRSARYSTPSCSAAKPVFRLQIGELALLIHLKNCSSWWTHTGSLKASRRKGSSACGTQVSQWFARCFSCPLDRLFSTSPRCQLRSALACTGAFYFWGSWGRKSLTSCDQSTWKLSQTIPFQCVFRPRSGKQYGRARHIYIPLCRCRSLRFLGHQVSWAACHYSFARGCWGRRLDRTPISLSSRSREDICLGAWRRRGAPSGTWFWTLAFDRRRVATGQRLHCMIQRRGASMERSAASYRMPDDWYVARSHVACDAHFAPGCSCQMGLRSLPSGSSSRSNWHFASQQESLPMRSCLELLDSCSTISGTNLYHWPTA